MEWLTILRDRNTHATRQGRWNLACTVSSTLSDNDYEEYSFLEVMEYLQPYDPFTGEDEWQCWDITPFLGSQQHLLIATDTTISSPLGDDKHKRHTFVQFTTQHGLTRQPLLPSPPQQLKQTRRTPDGYQKSGSLSNLILQMMFRFLRRWIRCAHGRHTEWRYRYKFFVRSIYTKLKRYSDTMRRIIQARVARRRRNDKNKIPRQQDTPLVLEITIGPDVKVDTLPTPKSYEDMI